MMKSLNLFTSRIGILTFIFIMILSCSSFAQDENSATVTGQVLDSTGAAIQNVTVIAKNTATGQTRQVKSNQSGIYTVYPLSPGDYEVSAEQAGFKKTIVSVKLNVKDRRPIDLVLEVGEATETVIITDEPPLIQESSVGQTLVSGNQVTELPLNNRNFIRLLETVPGVSSDLEDESNFGLTSRANISINGLRRNAVNYVVDGVNNVDVGSNITLLSTPTVDSILEFKVLTSNYTAEVGRSGGGSVIIVTRGGGNKFSGTLYEFVRNDAFNSNTFFNNRLGRDTNGDPVADVPRLRYNNFGGTIGGPVFFPNFGEGGPVFYNGRDKTFFFVSLEARRISRATTTANSTVPTAAQRNGDLSTFLGNPLCIQQNGTTISTNCTAAGAVPFQAFDTAGNLVQVRQNQVFRPSDNRPYANNVIPTSEIDPRALGLLAAYPLPNSGTTGFTFSPTSVSNTRQEVFRIDHNFNSNHKIYGRYTQDLSDSEEAGGLFTGIALPNVATTTTTVPGKILAISYTGVFSNNIVNEFSYNFSANEIASDLIGNGRRSDYANAEAIQEFFPENNANAIPTISGTGFSTIGALQGYSIEYANSGFRNTLTWTKGNHVLKFGGEWTSEIKNENAGNPTQGSFGFSSIQTRGVLNGAAVSTTGLGFGSFLLGRANSYSEAETDFRVNLRFGRREFFVQDTWKVRPNITLDLGLRYQYFVPPYDKNDQLGSFDPFLYDPVNPNTACANTACTAFNPSFFSRDNGIGIANSTSRFGRSIIPKDFNNFSPRVGIAWDPFKDGKTIVRAGYGFYYDQALVGIFEQAAFLTPQFSPTASFTSTTSDVITFDNPGAGTPPGTLPRVFVVAIAPDFETPETQQWSLGIQREVFKNAVAEISYVGTKGDKLIRRRNLNFVTPADTVAVGTNLVGRVVPFLGFSTIRYQETSAISRYHGLLSSFNYRLPKGFTVTLAYTWSKALTDSTNDRDAIDEPQNAFNLRPEYAEARTSRPHIFSASYVYEIPFFRKSENAALRLLLGGWQVSGITNIESGAPVARVIVASTLSGTRGLYPNLFSDPNSGLTGSIDPATGLPFIFDPTAFEPAPTGEFGNAPRSFARLPGRNQTNLALSKQFYFNTERTTYLQIRAESFNLFNHTQFTGISTVLPTAGPLSNTTFGRPTSTRFPREFQFGIKFYF
ncbi:MAG: carboxypeptidase regulatory-like domain-containing protein [Aridibacter sp.]